MELKERVLELNPCAMTGSDPSLPPGVPAANRRPERSHQLAPIPLQDDWRINRKLTINYGIRWETQLPRTGLDDKWSDFSPTTANPGAGGIPGALIYAGSGDGRQGSRTLADSWFGGWGPRIGMAYQLYEKTVVRTSYGRSFGAVTTVTGSTHQRGFTQTYGVPDQGTNGVQPNLILKNGFPTYPIPPFIDPSFANKDNIPWWQGKEATRLPEQNSGTSRFSGNWHLRPFWRSPTTRLLARICRPNCLMSIK